jgi:dipeptidyl aminopeptidase/acylaminoacyl peptidase
MRRTGCALAATVLALGGTLTFTAGGAGAGDAIPAPEGLPDFYEVPQPLPAKPGKLIKSERVDAPDVDGTLYRVMYTSTDRRDKTVAVTGVVAVPDGEAPDGGFPVVSWAHGTNGQADTCAASLKPEDSAPLANQMLEQGILVTATDYRGEGTPGLHPYIAGEAAARDTIDIVRAARQLKDAQPSTDYIVWGHSQGGHTAMHALRIAGDYAPELDLHGVVAGAPPSQFNLLYNFLRTSPYKHYLLMASGGLNAYYGDKLAPLDKVLNPEGIDLLDLLERGCSDFVADETRPIGFETVTKADPFTVAEWRKLLEENDPQQFTDPTDVRLLVIHGGDDEQIPTVASQIMSEHLCELGQPLERWVYPGNSHAGVIDPSFPDTLRWMSDRFAGETGAFTPTGQPDVQILDCLE